MTGVAHGWMRLKEALGLILRLQRGWWRHTARRSDVKRVRIANIESAVAFA